MVLSTSAIAKTACIIGITGQQGGSVAKALISSSKPYRLFGITRDTSKPNAVKWAQEGVEMREATVREGAEADVAKAFAGADIVFAVTNPNEYMNDPDRERKEGQVMVDAAKSAGVKLFVWSSIIGIKDHSNGKYSHCPSFDNKAAVTKCLAASGLPYRLVPCGSFKSNYLAGGHILPFKKEDGTYVLRLPVPSNSLMPLLDTPVDYGEYVREAIETEGLENGAQVVTGSLTSMQELVDGLSKASGKTVKYEEVDKKTYREEVLGPHASFMAPFLLDMFGFFAEFGYYGDVDVAANQRAVNVTPRTWEEILATHEGAYLNE
ncbi:NAD(P)-binding protein [Meredithblackwellia eburnea MCA 4105]